jgi:hypothetical protein
MKSMYIIIIILISLNTHARCYFATSTVPFTNIRLTDGWPTTNKNIAIFASARSLNNLLTTYPSYSQNNVVLGSSVANTSITSSIGSTCFVVRGASANATPWNDSADYLFLGFHGGSGCTTPLSQSDSWDTSNGALQWLISGYDGLGNPVGPEGTNANVGRSN